jgi:hypothetical protein
VGDGALARVPAWGQMHNGAWWKGRIIGGTEGVLIYRLIDDRNALNDLSAQIDEARANNDPVTEAALVAEYNDRSNKHVARQWWLGALVAYSMLDAYIDAHFKHFAWTSKTIRPCRPRTARPPG